MKILSKIILISLFLMAFQCEEECDCVFPEILNNSYKVSVTSESNFSTNDTIWISGYVSSMVFDTSINDSIFLKEPLRDVFSIYKFVTPNQTYNCIDAIDKFKIIESNGKYKFFESCRNATIIMNSNISSDNLYYHYKLGLIPIISGDYVISFQNSELLNSNRNTNIIDEYLIINSPNEIGFNSCGSISWRILNETDREYYFNVE